MPRESAQSDQTLVDQVLSLTQVKKPVEPQDNKFSIGKILMDKLGFNNHLVSQQQDLEYSSSKIPTIPTTIKKPLPGNINDQSTVKKMMPQKVDSLDRQSNKMGVWVEADP